MRLAGAKWLDRVGGSALGRLLAAGDGIAELVAPPPPVREVRHVLLVKFWGLGNWALLRPVVRDLRRHRPEARWTIATLAPNAPLVEDLADRLLLVRPRGAGPILADLLRAVAALRRDPPDLALDFEQFARTGALLGRLGAARQRIGFASSAAGRDGLYTVVVGRRPDVHAARAFRDLAEAAGLPPGPYVPGALEPTEHGRRALDLLHLAAPYVVLHPGSGDNFPGRRWSAEGFAALGRHARRRGLDVVVTGTAAEKALTSRVARGAGGRDLAGRLDVEGLVALLAGAEALAANDTGPVHLASALDVPTLAIYGPNTPVRYGPLASRRAVLHRRLPCSPCLTEASYRSSRCRLPTCMQAIGVAGARAALDGILAGARAPDRGRRAAKEATWRVPGS